MKYYNKYCKGVFPHASNYFFLINLLLILVGYYSIKKKKITLNIDFTSFNSNQTLINFL